MKNCLAALELCWSFIRMNLDKHFNLVGQIGGYSAGAAAWLGIAKDVIGFIGIAAGAALSVWALIERIRKARNG